MENYSLKKYLHDVLELEKMKFKTQQLIEKMEKQKFEDALLSQDFSPVKHDDGGMVSGCVIGGIIGCILGASYTPLFLMFVVLGVLLGGAIGYIRDKSSWDELEESKNRKNTDIEKQNERIKTTNYYQNKMVGETVEKLKQLGAKTEKSLERIYSQNIIYPKYRNLIALSSLFEYIDSGRCAQLEGANGAYNIYEMEVRLDKIITKMDVIISKLDQIITNQYYLYSAVKEIQPQVAKISTELVKHTKKLDTIQLNSAITAYTTQVIERNQYYERNWTNGRGYYDHINAPR